MTLTDRGGTPALVVNAKALKKGRCKGNEDTEREIGNAHSDCAEQRPQTAGVEEERGQGGMIVRVQRHSWNTSISAYEPYDIPFTSNVYAINGNEFLVYDPGTYIVAPHFEWCDFMDCYVPDEKTGEYEYFVTLESE